jgi:hypothetical protein
VARQVGCVLEEAELVDVPECALDHDEQDALVPNVPAGAQDSVLTRYLAPETVGVPEPDNMPAAVFGSAGILVAAAGRAGVAILVPRRFVQADWVQKLTQYSAQVVIKIDVAQVVKTLRSPEGKFERVVVLPSDLMTLRIRHMVAQHAGVR